MKNSIKPLKKRAYRRVRKIGFDDKLNSEVEKYSKKAFSRASLRASKRHTIVASIDNRLYKIYPNGRKEFIKELEPSKKITNKRFAISL